MKEFTPEETYEFILKQSIPFHQGELRSGNPISIVSSKGSLYTRYRQLAVLEWHLHKDAGKFKDYMHTAVQYDRDRFMDSCQRRPEIMYDTPLVLILDALNTGNLVFAKEFTQFLDDNHDYQTKPTAHPANWLYRCLVVLVLGRYEDQFEAFLEKLKKGYSTKQYGKLYPYALLLEAIWKNDERLFHENLHVIAETHTKMLRSLFTDYEDKLLCLWGLGICHLARMKGLKINIDHPFIPKALIE